MEKVSVILPCYNAENYVGDAIRSVLEQTYQNFELIIINDKSTDNSREIIRDFIKRDERLLFIDHEQNCRVARSRNDGIHLATGTLVALLDADDTWCPNKLEVQVSQFDSIKSCNFLHSDSNLIDQTGRPIGNKFSDLISKKEHFSGNLFHELCLRNFINVSTVIFRKKFIAFSGLFEERFQYLDDWIYWLKLARHTALHYCKQPLASYRIHPQNTVYDVAGYAKDREKAFKFILENYYDDLPHSVKAEIFYHFGVNYITMRKRLDARNCFRESIRHDKTFVRSYLRLIGTSLPSFA